MKPYYCPVCKFPIDGQSKEIAKFLQEMSPTADKLGLNSKFRRPMGLCISCVSCRIKLCFDSNKNLFRKYTVVDALFNTQGVERPTALSWRGTIILIAIALIVSWIIVELCNNGIIPSH